ncbi:VWA domain-containing protein [Phycicoccus sp. CSK15P-2]|uniref:VWA domain-containing protein n=1 Tax=Phycicoccus sp. CSK15P-2 TaxID=2807627 RepID=UPI00194E7A0A|nr:VWA domain-containing protein [Phycicoccus sp. CSK15P-2]MBM6404215.1 VWA domain-containing protein [Phycicoccus sp. CSK15P-2]
MVHYPFSAVVGSDDLALALVLTTVSPSVGGVLVRGEKGTAKSTIVRALVDLLPAQQVVSGCRFSCDPDAPDPRCPDGPHPADAPSERRPARLVELPVGATEDRVIGSLDLGRALGEGHATFQPGLLAAAHRGLLYVDEVNLLHDHLVDLLLDAAAMGRTSVERDGVSVSHAAELVLVGTMNPEEGELRPQLLDRFGLTVEVAASREPDERAEVVRRRLAFDADPGAFAARYSEAQADLVQRIAAARDGVDDVELTDAALGAIARVCAGFDVDGMRADIVTARAAKAHAAWHGRTRVTRADVRAAARLSLPHRRRRNPFDAPGLDEDLLDQLLDGLEDDPEPEPPGPGDDSPEGGASPEDRDPSPDAVDTPSDAADPGPSEPAEPAEPEPADARGEAPQEGPEGHGAAPTGLARSGQAFRPKVLRLTGVGLGDPGKRSRALTTSGRTVGWRTGSTGRLHLPATVTAAARARAAGEQGRLRVAPDHLRTAVLQGRESNLVLLAVDASGSMGARRRMEEVKTAVLSLLLDAYQRRDRVGLVSFRGTSASLDLSPTSSVEAAARCLETVPHGGRTPLAEGMALAARTLEVERIRDPRRRPLLVLVTDGRATSGPDALDRARRVADAWPATGVQSVVVDCETGRFRLGLAADLAARMGATHVPLGEVAADALVATVASAQAAADPRTPSRGRVA